MIRAAWPHGYDVVLKRRFPKIVMGANVYDEYGNYVYVESSRSLPGIPIWPEYTTEAAQDQERTQTTYIALLPHDVVVDAKDYLMWNGRDWEVLGEPQAYLNPNTATRFQQVRIQRIEG